MNQLNILLLDDDVIQMHALAAILEDYGYVIVGMATSSDEALTLFDQTQPDLVVLDIHLTGSALDGIDVGKAMLQKRSIPVIYLTAYAEEYYDKAKATHPAAFFGKPFNEREFPRAIDLAIFNFANNRTDPGSKILDVNREFANIHFAADCIWVKIKQKDQFTFTKVAVGDIRWISVENVYLNIYTECNKSPFVVILGLGKFMEHAAAYRDLIQVHRSHVVNIRHIKGFTPAQITLACGDVIDMSASYRDAAIAAILHP
jgi:two-component system, response regulator PdtaR